MPPDLMAYSGWAGRMGLDRGPLVLVLVDLVTKGAHADEAEDRDFWRTLALRGTELAKTRSKRSAGD